MTTRLNPVDDVAHVLARRLSSLEDRVAQVARSLSFHNEAGRTPYFRDLRDCGGERGVGLAKAQHGQVPVYRSQSSLAFNGWTPEDPVLQSHVPTSNTILSGQDWNYAYVQGTGPYVAPANHSHGTMKPRNPQTGYPYSALFGPAGQGGTGYFTGVAGWLGENASGPHYRPAGIYAGTDPNIAGSTCHVLHLHSQAHSNGHGAAAITLLSNTDGSALVKVYNDLDVNGAYSADTGADLKPLQLWLSLGNQTSTAYSNAGILDTRSSVATSGRWCMHVNVVAPQWQTTTAVERWEAVNNLGTGYIPVGASAFPTLSVRASKRNVKAMDAASAKLKALKPVRFKRRRHKAANGGEHSPAQEREFEDERIGLIAEDVAEVMPEAVAWTMSDGEVVPFGIDYAVVTAALLKGFQELAAEVESLKA